MMEHGYSVNEIQYNGEWYRVRWYDPIYGEYRIELNGEQRDIRKSWIENIR